MQSMSSRIELCIESMKRLIAEIRRILSFFSRDKIISLNRNNRVNSFELELRESSIFILFLGRA